MVYAASVYICFSHDITTVMQQWEKWVKTCKKGRLEGS